MAVSHAAECLRLVNSFITHKAFFILSSYSPYWMILDVIFLCKNSRAKTNWKVWQVKLQRYICPSLYRFRGVGLFLNYCSELFGVFFIILALIVLSHFEACALCELQVSNGETASKIRLVCK